MSANTEPSHAGSTERPEPESDRDDYVVGEAAPQRQDYATFETKPSPVNYTGGGYEHWRSVEYRPHTPGERKEDVYVSHHRLLALATAYPSEMSTREALDDLRGKDVHHESGVPWDNRPDNLSIVSHSRHSEITQTQRRAWAADKKREVERAEETPRARSQVHCDRCGREADTLAECAAWPDEKRCLECATQTADGHEILLP